MKKKMTTAQLFKESLYMPTLKKEAAFTSQTVNPEYLEEPP